MRLFKRIAGTIIVLLVIVSLIASCFAVGAEALLPAEIFGTLYSSYLASRGIGLVLSKNNVAASNGNTLAADPAAAMYLDMYTRANGRLPSADQMSIDDWVTFAEANVSTNIGPAGNVTPTYTTFQLGSALVEWFDQITTDYLTIDLGVPSESGVYHTSGNFFDSTVSTYLTPGGSFQCPVVTGNYSSVVASGIQVATAAQYNAIYFAAASAATVYVAANHNTNTLFFKTTTPNLTVYGARTDTQGFFEWNAARYNSSSEWYVVTAPLHSRYTIDSAVPYFSSMEEFLAAPVVDGSSSSYRMQLRPQDKYNEGLTDKDGKVLPKGDVYIPDATAAGYQPDTLTGTWNLPWSDAFTQSLTDALEGIRELILANDSVLEDEAVQPSPVEAPFLPPAAPGDLPSFEFNLSGIWHYVVDWVASLSNGFTLISSAWSALPYSMVIPIYASAVVVIVIGMWKRFFS